VALALFGSTLLLYARVRGHDWVGTDDGMYVLDNPLVREGLSWEGVKGAFTGLRAYNWHPLTWLSHMLDVELFGLRPGPHHLVSAALHAINAVLLFAALRALTGDLWPSAFVAALFALHPLRVESVAWIAERKDVLSGLFWMLALWAYARYARRPGLLRYGTVLACLALGLMAKPMLVSLPCVALLLDLWPLGRWRPGWIQPAVASGIARQRPLRLLVLEKLPLAGLAAGAAVATLVAQRGAFSTLEALPLVPRLANALIAYRAYLWKTVWPTGLAVFYPHPAVVAAADPSRSLILPAVAAGLLLLALTALVVLGAARRPYLVVGWLWYLGTLVPVIGLLQVGSQALADRYTYLPLIGVYVVLAWGLRDLAAGRRRRLRGVPGAAAALVLAGLAAASAIQIGHWRDSVALYGHAIRATRDNYFAYNSLGWALEQRGDVAAAAAHYARALEINPRYVQAHNNLGNLLALQNDPGAVRHYEQALRLAPGYAEAHNNLANVLQAQGDLDRAAEHYARALQLDPEHAAAHANLGRLLAQRGELDRAAGHFEHALAIRPDFVPAHYGLALVLIRQDRLADAVRHLRAALDGEPELLHAGRRLAWILATSAEPGLRDGAEALRWAERCAEATGYEDPDMLDTLAAAHAELGEFEQAVRWQTRAVELAPPETKATLAARLALYAAGTPYREGERGV
jgi:tetratricopeptide (TPR) repeat protein